MTKPLSLRMLSSLYGIVLTRGGAPQLADGTKVGGTALTAAKFTAYDAALAGVVPVTSVTYDAVADFTAGAATVANEVRGVTVDITDGDTALTLTLPTGAGNLGDVLTLTVALDGSTPGTLAVVCGGGVTLSNVPNGQYTFHCTGTGVWKNIGDNVTMKGIQTISSVTATHEAYTIPDRTPLVLISDSNTVLEDQIDAVITLPTGAVNIGKDIIIIVSLGADANKHTLDLVTGSVVGTTLEDLANGYYAFKCVDVGEWIRVVTQQSGALTDYGPGASITGDISAYNETTLKAILTALAAAGICVDDTTT